MNKKAFRLIVFFIISISLLAVDLQSRTRRNSHHTSSESSIPINLKTTSDNLSTALNKLFGTKIAVRSTTSVKIVAIADGQVLYSRNSRRPLVPASTMKLLTSSTALVKLGSNYKLKTSISTDDSTAPSKTIHGNVFLRGGGDPFLTTDDLRKMIQYMKSLGIDSIHGDIIADDSFFDQLYERKECIDEYTSIKLPLMSGLSIEENSMTVVVSAGRKNGEKVVVNVTPSLPTIRIQNTATTTRLRRSYPSVHINWSGDVPILVVSGRISSNRSPRHYTIPVQFPAWFAGVLFHSILHDEGIKVSGATKLGKTPLKTRQLAVLETPIMDVVNQMNKSSDNYAAEMMLKLLGAELRGTPGSLQSGLDVICDFLDEIGIDQSSYDIYDGSGISHSDQISSDAMVAILTAMYKHQDIFPLFYNSLSTAGVDGTLSQRMLGTYAENNLHAKTGTLHGVTSLAGYVTSADGEILAFSVNSNDFGRGRSRLKNIQDRLGAILANFSRGKIQG